MAEEEGFEPPEVLPSTVFKTAAIDHSAISPVSLRLPTLAGLPAEGPHSVPKAGANIESFFVL